MLCTHRSSVAGGGELQLEDSGRLFLAHIRPHAHSSTPNDECSTRTQKGLVWAARRYQALLCALLPAAPGLGMSWAAPGAGNRKTGPGVTGSEVRSQVSHRHPALDPSLSVLCSLALLALNGCQHGAPRDGAGLILGESHVAEALNVPTECGHGRAHNSEPDELSPSPASSSPPGI